MAKLKIKRWALTPHAAERLLERQIQIAALEQVLMAPEDVVR